MLTHIHIRDFAIIDHLDLELNPGMTVLSGETGAGKSILVDALGLALGDRADSGMVRHGRERAEVSADFAADQALRDWLREQDLDADDECLVRRTVSAEGRSRAWVNGRPVPATVLRELGERLVDIHGQQAHQSLLRPATQRAVLDEFAGHRKLLTRVAADHADWQAIARERDALLTAGVDRADRLDLLRYQSNELQELDLKPGEFERLEQERHRAANSTRLFEAAAAALETLDGDQQGSQAGVITGLSHAQARLQPLQADDARLTPLLELLDGAVIQAEEAAGELRGYLDGLESDPARLEALEQRLQRITDLARKHRVEPDQLAAVSTAMSDELATLENSDIHLEQLQQRLQQAADTYRAGADKLSVSRRKAAKRLGREVTANMQQMGMAGGRFEVHLEALEPPGAHGQEGIELRVSANPGQPPRALAKVASGGELSRISLALQVLISERLAVPTLVFDEVDVGIGGGVAEIVGRLLRDLGDGRQVLCVTHLPQVAAQGHHHLFVSKHSDDQQTGSAITQLQPEQRVEELARMLGGIEITDHTRSHARELLEQAQLSRAQLDQAQLDQPQMDQPQRPDTAT